MDHPKSRVRRGRYSEPLSVHSCLKNPEKGRCLRIYHPLINRFGSSLKQTRQPMHAAHKLLDQTTPNKATHRCRF